MAREVRRDPCDHSSDIHSRNAFSSNYNSATLTSETRKTPYHYGSPAQMHFSENSSIQETWRFSIYPPDLPIIRAKASGCEQPKCPLAVGARGQMRHELWA